MKTLGIVLFFDIFLHCLGEGKNCLRGFKYVCCSPLHESNGECIACPIGTVVNNIGEDCLPCEENLHGKNCHSQCNCQDGYRCDNVHGCIEETETTEVYELPTDLELMLLMRGTTSNTHKREYYKTQTELMTTLSISVAVISFLVLLIVVGGKCYSSFISQRKSILQAMTKKCKETPTERGANIYGSYCSGSKAKNDEYDFDSDEFEEDEYAVIRDSQMIPMSTVPVLPVNTEVYNMSSHYNTDDEYNHLNIMGIRHTPGKQQSKAYICTGKKEGKRLITLDDDYV